jgi:hypothetical protein
VAAANQIGIGPAGTGKMKSTSKREEGSPSKPFTAPKSGGRPAAIDASQWLVTVWLCSWLLAACTPAAAPTLFRPPSPRPGPAAPIPTGTPEPPATGQNPTAAVATSTPPCLDGLTFVQDLTFPDGTLVSPGDRIDKQWQVTNSGTCDWDARYRLRFTGGNLLDASAEQALYPIRAGASGVLSIAFSAPAESGTYQSQWQAFDPGGIPFGDSIYLDVMIGE